MDDSNPMEKVYAEIAKRSKQAVMHDDYAEMTLMGYRLKSKRGCKVCKCAAHDFHGLECTYAKAEISRVQKAYAGEDTGQDRKLPD